MGCPRKAEDVRQLVLLMATDNLTWGYVCISRAMLELGHAIGANTIKRILIEVGIPTDERHRRGFSWQQFPNAHWSTIAATDFFAVETLTWHALVR